MGSTLITHDKNRHWNDTPLKTKTTGTKKFEVSNITIRHYVFDIVSLLTAVSWNLHFGENHYPAFPPISGEICAYGDFRIQSAQWYTHKVVRGWKFKVFILWNDQDQMITASDKSYLNLHEIMTMIRKGQNFRMAFLLFSDGYFITLLKQQFWREHQHAWNVDLIPH